MGHSTTHDPIHTYFRHRALPHTYVHKLTRKCPYNNQVLSTYENPVVNTEYRI